MKTLRPSGAGLGFRRELIPALKTRVPDAIDFFELAPENWIDMGGAYGRELHGFTERYPFVCHGLSLSLGGPSPLDEMLLRKTRQFMDAHGITLYTEHLSYCSDDGHLYDLLPIPFTEEAVHYVAARIRRAQDILERRIAIENASYYTASPIAEMDEITFIRAVLEEADCDLHLDVNNVYVNSVNHRYDPLEFIRALPTERIVYLHIGGALPGNGRSAGRHPRRRCDRSGVDAARRDLPAPRRGTDAAGARLQHSAAGRSRA